jgi:hypothetical protein
MAAIAVAVTCGPIGVAQAASYKSCGPAIKHKRFGKAVRIRVTKRFPCRYARDSIRNWLRGGASTQYGMEPWNCRIPYRRLGTYRDLVRCQIRTSFGGTKPLRRYRLGFIYDIRS